MFPSIYLASQSPRRSELLQQIAVDFTVIDIEIDEQAFDGELPDVYVERIAIEKAKAGLIYVEKYLPVRSVLSADTSVVLDNKIFGKPQNIIQAREMLQTLSGQTHQVMTAVALACNKKILTSLSVSEVSFAELSEKEIEWYLSTSEGSDKAGGYAIQGMAALFIEKIHGSYSGIMGLPIRETGQLLMQMDSESE